LADRRTAYHEFWVLYHLHRRTPCRGCEFFRIKTRLRQQERRPPRARNHAAIHASTGSAGRQVIVDPKTTVCLNPPHARRCGLANLRRHDGDEPEQNFCQDQGPLTWSGLEEDGERGDLLQGFIGLPRRKRSPRTSPTSRSSSGTTRGRALHGHDRAVRQYMAVIWLVRHGRNGKKTGAVNRSRHRSRYGTTIIGRVLSEHSRPTNGPA